MTPIRGRRSVDSDSTHWSSGGIDSLQGDEPWPGYDELAVQEVRAVLSEGDDSRIEAARSYERKHKNRAGVLQATERELSNA